MNLVILISNLTAAFMLIFAAVVLLLVKSQNDSGAHYYKRAKRWLVFALFVAALSIFVALDIGKFHDNRQIEVLNIYSLFFFFVISISLLLAFTHLYNSEKLSTRTLMWIFAPGAVFIAAYVVLAWFCDSPKVYSLEELFDQIPSHPILILRVLILLATLGGSGICIYNYLQARHMYRAMLNDYFSDDYEMARTRWIDRMFHWALVLAVVAVISYLTSQTWYDLFFCLILAIVMACSVANIINYQNRFVGVAPAVEFAQKAREAASEQHASDPVAQLLLEQWQRHPDKYYLTPGLTLNDVSRMTGLGRHRLSSYLNSVMGVSFNAWITALRLHEVERRLLDWQEGKTLSEIAYETGFSDLAAMSNAFKRTTGLSPSQFRRNSAAAQHK